MSARKENWNETAWEPNQPWAGPSRGAMEDQLESLKERLLTPLLASVDNVALIHELRWVANEAAALAWFTVCPLLVLPALLEEKVHAALQRWERQRLLWERHNRATTAEKTTASVVHHLTPAVMAA